MDQSKIENFEKANPERRFPAFEALSHERCREVRRRVCEHLELDETVSGLEIVNGLHWQTGRRLGEVPEGSFSLRDLVTGAGLAPASEVLINWYRFDDIDKIDIDRLSKYFDDIWYPSADDIEIFDESCKWFLSVSHDGQLTLIEV
jgi:hypothetical protein